MHKSMKSKIFTMKLALSILKQTKKLFSSIIYGDKYEFWLCQRQKEINY